MRTALVLAGLAGIMWPGGAAAQSYRTLVESRRLDRTEPLRVEVGFGVGRFRLGPADGPQLFRVGLTYLEDQFDPKVTYDPRTGHLQVNIEGRKDGVDLSDIDDSRQRLDILLTPEVPVTLDLAFGAIEADLELGGLTLRSAAIRTGASQTTVSFHAPNRAACGDLAIELGAAEFEVVGLGNSRCRSVSVKGGVGEITLDFSGDWPAGADMNVRAAVGLGSLNMRVPEGVGVRLNVDRFLAGLSLSGFTKRGSAYYSADYERASAKLVIDVDAAFGSIDLDWIR